MAYGKRELRKAHQKTVSFKLNFTGQFSSPRFELRNKILKGLNSSEVTPAVELAKALEEHLWEPIEWNDYLGIFAMFTSFLVAALIVLVSELVVRKATA